MKHYMKLSILFLLSLVTLSSSALADVNDTVTVDVGISSVAQIIVSPDTLSWTVAPGQAGSNKLLDIKNTGSVNVSQIYAYVDTLEDEHTRPYTLTYSTNYSAGAVITFKNETYDKYFFAGRLEWNWTEDISNMLKTDVTSPKAWGFFKNTSVEYNWLVGNGTDGFCNNTATQFAIEDEVDNGTAASRYPTIASISCGQADENYTYCSVGATRVPLSEGCVAIYKDCSKIYLYKYDKRPLPNFASCANSAYIQLGNLTPSDPPHTLTLKVYIPYGIPFGSLNTSTFTVYASSS